nr:uncharacterized protein LOC110132098 isoform X3 [Odocoileus virginianus texanus]
MPFSGDLHLPRLMGEWSPELNVPSPLGKCDYVTQHPDSQAWSPCWSSVKSAHIYHLFPGRDHPAAAARIPAALRPSLVSPQEATGRRLCSPHNCPAGAVKRAALSTSVSEPGMQNSAPDPSRTDSIQQRRTPESVNPGSKDADAGAPSSPEGHLVSSSQLPRAAHPAAATWGSVLASTYPDRVDNSCFQQKPSCRGRMA